MCLFVCGFVRVHVCVCVYLALSSPLLYFPLLSSPLLSTSASPFSAPPPYVLSPPEISPPLQRLSYIPLQQLNHSTYLFSSSPKYRYYSIPPPLFLSTLSQRPHSACDSVSPSSSCGSISASPGSVCRPSQLGQLCSPSSTPT